MRNIIVVPSEYINYVDIQNNIVISRYLHNNTCRHSQEPQMKIENI